MGEENGSGWRRGGGGETKGAPEGLISAGDGKGETVKPSAAAGDSPTILGNAIFSGSAGAGTGFFFQGKKVFASAGAFGSTASGST